MDATLARVPHQVNGFKLTSDAVRQGYAELFSRYVWDCFGTHTYRPKPKAPERFSGAPGGRVGGAIEGCERNFRWWIGTVCLREACARGLARCWIDPEGRTRAAGAYENARRRGRPAGAPVWVVGLERHKSGLLHMHSLIKWPSMLPDVRRDAAWKLWHDVYGGGRFEPPRCLSVVDYIAKYVVKGGDLVWSHSFDAPRMAC